MSSTGMVEWIKRLYGQNDEVKVPEESTHFVHIEPGTRCQCVQVKGVCGNAIVDYGVNGEGFCESCWEPDITAAHELYRTYRSEKYTRQEAIELAGIPAKDLPIRQTTGIKHEKSRRTTNYIRVTEPADEIGKVASAFGSRPNEVEDE